MSADLTRYETFREHLMGGQPDTSRESGASRWESPGRDISCVASDLAGARENLLATGPGQLDAAALREALLNLHESWLTARALEMNLGESSGFAIVATGGLGRRELLPYSDLDLMLLHDDMPADVVGQVADLLWYPLWDANIRLDHSVRTVPEALEVANTETYASLAMLEARHIAGDTRLSALLVDGARRQWRSGIRARFAELVETTQDRWRRAGEIAYRAEPDLMFGRGGLRDVQLLDALAVAQLADRHAGPGRGSGNPAGSLADAYRALLDVRTELHRVSGRERNVLLAQHADDIASALNIGERFDLARMLSGAARTISYHVDAGLRTAANALPQGRMSLVRRPQRRPLDEGVIESAGEVVLARDARPDRDAGLVLRVAAASARAGLPIAAGTLHRLVTTAQRLPIPWPRTALDDLLVLLAAGPDAVATIEALDRTGLWGRLFPEWAAVRDLPPRDVVHAWTVDRHLIETVARASALTTRVARPDLLLLGALLHDIGKGRSSDHSVIGAELAIQIGASLGLRHPDVEMLSKLVRHHLLLSRMAIGRDLNDPETIDTVISAVGGNAVLLDVLHALTEADSLATGPAVWSDWKASLVDDLVRRCRMVMAGEDLPQADPVDPEHLSLAADRGVHVQIRQSEAARIHRVVMIAPDRRGLLSKAAGVLALNSLRVNSASVNIHDGVAINEFAVSPHFGSPVAAELLRQQFIGALAGDVDVLGMLAQRDEDSSRAVVIPVGEVPTGVPANRLTVPPRILWFDGTAPGRVIIEVRAMDRPGLLARLTWALERAGVDILWAKVATTGSTVDDVFCVVLPERVAAVEPAAEAHTDVRAAIEERLLAVLGAEAPEEPTPS